MVDVKAYVEREMAKLVEPPTDADDYMKGRYMGFKLAYQAILWRIRTEEEEHERFQDL